jgi:division protein CdvB (Snf7/Vps24/ESCRT-III family)
MDKFESQFTDLDVQTSYMEGAMSDTTAVATPQDQVDNLINQVADEAGLEREHALQLPPTAAPAVAAPAAVEKDKVGEEDGRLADRLRALRVSAYLRNGELGTSGKCRCASERKNETVLDRAGEADRVGS